MTFAAASGEALDPGELAAPVGKCPDQAEISNPDVLYTNWRRPRCRSGSAARGGSPASRRRHSSERAQSFKADYIDASGNLIGTVSRNITGGKARLLGAKTQASTKVSRDPDHQQR